MITIKDIAKRAGVSVATVSYVLNNTRYVSQEKKDLVLRAVEELNYVPNAVARGLRARTSGALGLVLSDITNPFYPDLAKGCEDIAQAAGYSLIILNTNEQEERMVNAVSLVREGKVDGLIIASALKRDQPLLEKLYQEGRPFVLAHRSLPGLQADSVVADNKYGINSAVRYLMTLGHRKIAMLTGNEESFVNIDRKEGFIKAIKDNGLICKEEWLINTLGNNKLSYNAAVEILRIPSDQRPTALITLNDMGAVGVMDAVQDMGLQVPQDLSIIGFDDLFISAIRTIQLSTVRIPRYDIGQQATKMLIDRIQRSGLEEPINIVLPTQLVIRKTTGTLSIG